jgi:hypothetical protein
MMCLPQLQSILLPHAGFLPACDPELSSSLFSKEILDAEELFRKKRKISEIIC